MSLLLAVTYVSLQLTSGLTVHCPEGSEELARAVAKIVEEAVTEFPPMLGVSLPSKRAVQVYLTTTDAEYERKRQQILNRY